MYIHLCELNKINKFVLIGGSTSDLVEAVATAGSGSGPHTCLVTFAFIFICSDVQTRSWRMKIVQGTKSVWKFSIQRFMKKKSLD